MIEIHPDQYQNGDKQKDIETERDVKLYITKSYVMEMFLCQRMFKTFTIFCKFFKSLILRTLWIYNFCDFMSYLGFWLYLGCMDFSHFLQLQDHKTELVFTLQIEDNRH